jgi:hypothetical protein
MKGEKATACFAPGVQPNCGIENGVAIFHFVLLLFRRFGVISWIVRCSENPADPRNNTNPGGNPTKNVADFLKERPMSSVPRRDIQAVGVTIYLVVRAVIRRWQS